MKFIPTVMKNFLAKPATRMYPIAVREPFEGARGELYNEIEKCIFCKSCERKCPSQCITVDKDNATWNYDPYACVYCGLCVEACPAKCLHQKKQYRAPARAKEYLSLKGELKVRKKAAAAHKDDAAPAAPEAEETEKGKGKKK